MDFYTPYDNPPVPVCDYIDPDDKVIDTAGYIPPIIQINNLLAAGDRLNEYRRLVYNSGDFETDDQTPVGENVYDPTHRYDYDFAQAHSDAVAIAQKAYDDYLASHNDTPEPPASPEPDSSTNPPPSQASTTTPAPSTST